jgi:hypothetical protein
LITSGRSGSWDGLIGISYNDCEGIFQMNKRRKVFQAEGNGMLEGIE